MADASKSVQIKDYPTRVPTPPNAPDYFKDYTQSVEQWGRELVAALRQAQSKIASLEGK